MSEKELTMRELEQAVGGRKVAMSSGPLLNAGSASSQGVEIREYEELSSEPLGIKK